MKNIFKNLDFNADFEVVSDVFCGKKFRIERILSSKQTTKWLNQNSDEWVCLLRGKAKIKYKNGKIERLGRGDTLFIPKNRWHKVVKTSKKCLWLCVFESANGL